MSTRPIFKIGDNDYTKYLAEDGLKPTKNDLDADGSGRNLLDGFMYRSKIASKAKWTVSFNRLSAETMARLSRDMNAEYVKVTMLDPTENRHIERTYYCATINAGVQRYIGGTAVYDGVTFNLTER